MPELRLLPLLAAFFAAACAAQPAAPGLTAVPLAATLDQAIAVTVGPTTDPLMATMELLTLPPLARYESARHGYSFEYPVTSELTEAANGDVVLVDQQIEVRVTTTNPEAASPERIIESAEDTTLAGGPARRLSGYIAPGDGRTPQNFRSIAFSQGGSYLVITTYEVRTDLINPPRTRGEIPLTALATFDTIVGSFTRPNGS